MLNPNSGKNKLLSDKKSELPKSWALPVMGGRCEFNIVPSKLLPAELTLQRHKGNFL